MFITLYNYTTLLLSIFIILCISLCDLFATNCKFVPLNNISLFPPFPSPGDHHFTLFLNEFLAPLPHFLKSI